MVGNAAIGPHASKVTVLVMENRDYYSIVGNASAPYINKTLIPQGALLRNSHAVSHPSEPNYLALFSGSTQGVTSDDCPLTFSANNLGAQLLNAGKTFKGYSESMPSNGYTGCGADGYARKHNPWVNFTNVPKAMNLVWRGWPAYVPTVTFIVPNLCDDMHDCSTQTGDKFLSKLLPQIIAWNAQNDGLLIVTWDEASPDDGTNHIATVLVGPMVKAGAKSTQNVNHYGVLHTVETIFGLPCVARSCQAPAISGIWK